MTINLAIHIGWPIAAMILAWCWLPVCVGIGNVLQREWWFNVLALSVGCALVLTVFALVSVVVPIPGA